MLEGNTEDKPTLDENYQGACEAPSLRLEEHRLSAVDMVAAAGMNRHRTGLTLLRLASEWGASAKPAPSTPEQIEALARSYTPEGPTVRIKVPMTSEQIERAITEHGLDRVKVKSKSWHAWVEAPNPHQGKVMVQRDGAVAYMLPLRRANEEARDWHRHELGLLLMGLKSLPAVRDAILARSQQEEWGCDEHVVAAVLLWWLDPKCNKCGGRQDVVKLRGKEVGKVCSACKGSGLERQGDPPHGPKGKKIASHIRDCLADARRELREGAYRERRTNAGRQHRGESVADE